MHSNFITPPDHIFDQSLHTVLIVDATEREVAEVASVCQIVGTDFNVYLYHSDMEEIKWLELSFNVANSVLVNSVPNHLSPIKDRLVGHKKCFYYGPKNFFDNPRRIENPSQYFVSYVKNLVDSENT